MAETVSKKLADAEEEEKTTLDLSRADLDDSAMAGLVEALPVAHFAWIAAAGGAALAALRRVAAHYGRGASGESRGGLERPPGAAGGRHATPGEPIQGVRKKDFLKLQNCSKTT